MFIPGYTANPSGFGAQGNKLLTAYIIFDGPYEVSGAMWYDKNGDGVKNGYWFYIDQNGNNAKDTSEPSRNCTSTSDPACSSWRLWYIDSENIQPGTGGSFSTSPYTISYSAAGTYQINASIPPGYTLRNVPGNTNPRSVTVNANLTNVNFELASVSTPQCAGSGAGLSVNPTGVYARNGSYATFTVGPCTPLTPTPQYRWPTPTAGVFPTPTCGVNCVYQPPPSVCSVQTITQSVEVSNGGGASTYSASLAILPYNQATGVVYTDTGNNNCSSGETVKPNTQVLLVDGGSGVTSDSTNTNSSGVYTLTDTVACSNKHIIIPGQTIKRVRPDGGAWSSTGFTGSDYGPFTFTTPVKTVDFCLGGFDPWYQTDKGDVRFVNLFNALPTSSSYASTETLYPSVFFSSASTPDFNGGNASTLNWQIGREYTYNKVSAGTLGGMSYTFYDSQTKKKNVSVLALPGCPANPDGTPASGNCTLNFSSIAASPKLPSGVYKVLGNLTIQNTYAITQSDQHVVILVQGETFIGDTTTPASITTAPALGNLFILASKGTMHISPLVGTSNYVQNGASSVTQLDGYYTSEGSIGIESNADCSASTPVLDLRLNMGGMVTANSLHPLQTGQSGRVVNYRTLCNTNATSPSFFVKYRADFLTQMTDFYKTTLKTFKEVAP